MGKFCVFCGNQPVKRNKEHVIPRWLIEYTGDPKRKINLGVNWNISGKSETRLFPFNNFTVPACTDCNKSHSILEANTKAVIIKIFSNQAVSNEDINTLLNWFDKVRVGLWLADYFINKNYMSITPKFQIDKRIASYDRCLLIYRQTEYIDGINFSGFGIPSFQYLPSCFYLRIKDIVFFNVSSSYLFSRRLGFPFPSEIFWTEDLKRFGIAGLVPARERIMYPIFQWAYDNNCVEIYQPIYSFKLVESTYEDPIAKFFNIPYVVNNSLDCKRGLGGIFIKTPSHNIHKIEGDFLLEIPQRYDPLELYKVVASQNLEFLNKLSKIPSVSMLPIEQQREVKKYYNFVKMTNRHFLKAIQQARSL